MYGWLYVLLAMLVNVHDMLIEAGFTAQCNDTVPEITTSTLSDPLMGRLEGRASVMGRGSHL